MKIPEYRFWPAFVFFFGVTLPVNVEFNFFSRPEQADWKHFILSPVINSISAGVIGAVLILVFLKVKNL